jgi:hypothetical protein
MKGYDQAQASYDAQEPKDDERTKCMCDLDPREFPCDSCLSQYHQQSAAPTFWTCCGGIELQEDDRCPVCNEEY